MIWRYGDWAKARTEDFFTPEGDEADLLGLMVGGKSRVSEILNRKRKLTVEMIRKLNRRLNLSPELLISDYKLAKEKVIWMQL